MLNCRDISKLLSQSLEKRLTWKQRLEIRIHLFICRVCHNYWKQLKFLHTCILRYYDKTIEKYQTDQVKLSSQCKNNIQKIIDSEIKK